MSARTQCWACCASASGTYRPSGWRAVPGLVNIYRALCVLEHDVPRELEPEKVAELGMRGDDPRCEEALTMFCARARHGRRQPGRHARCARRTVHRRRHRAEAGRLVRPLAVPRPLRAQGTLLQLRRGGSHLRHPGREPRAARACRCAFDTLKAIRTAEAQRRRGKSAEVKELDQNPIVVSSSGHALPAGTTLLVANSPDMA